MGRNNYYRLGRLLLTVKGLEVVEAGCGSHFAGCVYLAGGLMIEACCLCGCKITMSGSGGESSSGAMRFHGNDEWRRIGRATTWVSFKGGVSLEMMKVADGLESYTALVSGRRQTTSYEGTGSCDDVRLRRC